MAATTVPGDERVPLGRIAAEWTRIGCIGFGGPPAHIALLRRLCVEDRQWLSASEFEDGLAAVNLLPGPASTQLAIYCAWRLRRIRGALLGGLCFIVPGLLLILLLSALFLERHPPRLVVGAAAGAGSAVAAVALNAAIGLAPASWRRAGRSGRDRSFWVAYAAAGAAAAALVGPYLVIVLALAGVVEVVRRSRAFGRDISLSSLLFLHVATAVSVGGIGALAWVAFKVGALSYGGGFVIVPLMQTDAVHTFHWMTNSQFLAAVALGQITPGPVVQTVAVIGYAADKLTGGILAPAIAFAPSFLFATVGGPHFERLRRGRNVQAFLSGAGPAAIGAIVGSAIPLARALVEGWQYAVLAGAVLFIVVLRRSPVVGLLLAAIVGICLAAGGVHTP